MSFENKAPESPHLRKNNLSDKIYLLTLKIYYFEPKANTLILANSKYLLWKKFTHKCVTKNSYKQVLVGVVN